MAMTKGKPDEGIGKGMTEASPERGAPAAAQAEPAYTVHELVECAANVFGPSVRKECIVAAFRDKGLDAATVREARQVVDGFLKRGVV